MLLKLEENEEKINSSQKKADNPQNIIFTGEARRWLSLHMKNYLRIKIPPPLLVILEDTNVISLRIIQDHQLNDSLPITRFSSEGQFALFTKKGAKCRLVL